MSVSEFSTSGLDVDADILLKEGPIQKYGYRFGKIRRTEQRWMKLTNIELSFALSMGTSPIVQIPIPEIEFVYTKDSLPKDTKADLKNNSDLDSMKDSSKEKRVEFLKTDITHEDFVICTSSRTGHKGKQYVFKALSSRLRDEWVDAIGSQITLLRTRPSARVQRYQNPTCFQRFRSKLRLIMFADDFQAFIGFLVIYKNICK